MARITVEDCLPHVHNRFDLVLVAAKRARQIVLGSKPLIEPHNDKATVVALREIAAGVVNREKVDEIATRESGAAAVVDPFAEPASAVASPATAE